MVCLPRTGFISCSLLNVALSHDSCHLDKMYLLIKDLKSVHGCLKIEISRSSEAFAFTSAASLPFMPTWLGSQQNKISLVFDNVMFFDQVLNFFGGWGGGGGWGEAGVGRV